MSVRRVAQAVSALALVTLATPRAALAEVYSFVKGPYLQSLDTSSVVVRWEGSQPVPGTITVKGPFAPPEGADAKKAAKGADKEEREFVTKEPSEFHSVELKGLLPATTYAYVVSAGDAKSAEGHFTTAPADTRPFHFLLYGDNRTDPTAHAAVVKAMLNAPGDFLLHTGDMVHEGDNDRDWTDFFGIEAQLLRDRCIFSSIGNHELIGSGAPPWLRYFHPGSRSGPRGLFYSTRWSNARFFFLNAMVPWDGAPDRGWIEAELAKADEEPGVDLRFVIMHQSLWSSGPHGASAMLERQNVAALFRKHKVTAVFAGHDHLYERGEKDGVRYIISGGGGAPLYKPRRSPHSATTVVESVHHFVEAKVDGKSVMFTVRRVDGSTLEHCKLDQEGPWNCDVALPAAHKPPPPGPAASTGTGTGTAPPAKKACDCAVVGGQAPSARPHALVLLFSAAAWLRRKRATREILRD